MNRLRLLVLIVVLSAITVLGCSSPPAPSSTAPSSTVPPGTEQTEVPSTKAPATPSPATAQKQYGGVLTMLTNTLPPQIGQPSEINQFTYIYSSTCGPVYERLFNRTVDYSPTPGLVQSWEIASDNKSIIWHLKKGVKFQDGTDFNAQAVIYNLESQAATPLAKGSFANVTSYDVIDDYTLRVNLSKFDAVLMPGVLAGYMGYIASPTAMQKTGTGDVAAASRMVGVGPFKFAEYERDVLLKFTKWDGYYEKGKPYLDAIVIRGCTDYTTKLLAFKAGDGQFVSDVRASDVASLRAQGATIKKMDVSACFGLMPDSADESSPWSDIRVRQAAQYAIDTNAIAKAIYGEAGEGTTQAAIPSDPYYVPGLDRPYNPSKAKELLTSAGYANGFKTTFYVDMMLVNAQNYSAAVQSYLKAIGIDVDIELCDMPRLSELKIKGWKGVLDAGSMITGLSGFAQLFSVYPRTSSLISMARPAGFQDMIDATVSESDDAKRLQMYKGLIKAMFDDCTYVLTYAQALIFAMNPEVHDMEYGKNFIGYWTPENTWLSAKK